MVRKLEADCTFELLVLEGREDRETEDKCEERWRRHSTRCYYFILRATSVLKFEVKKVVFTLLCHKAPQAKTVWTCWPWVLVTGQKGCRSRQEKDNIQCPDSGSKRVENYFMALYLHSLSVYSGCGCSCSSSVKGALYLAQPRAHCVALSLDWVWLRQPNILRLSTGDKLHSTMRKARI